jgi:hypothetical protein
MKKKTKKVKGTKKVKKSLPSLSMSLSPSPSRAPDYYDEDYDGYNSREFNTEVLRTYLEIVKVLKGEK